MVNGRTRTVTEIDDAPGATMLKVGGAAVGVERIKSEGNT